MGFSFQGDGHEMHFDVAELVQRKNGRSRKKNEKENLLKVRKKKEIEKNS